MKKFLEYLTVDDRSFLLEAGELCSYDSEDIVLQEGSTRAALFVVLSGYVRVEQNHLGRGVELATLGPNDVFGEMSFLEGTKATADIICNEPAKILVLEGDKVLSLLQSTPGMAESLYQSLAKLLSERLRVTSERIPSLLVDEIPQVGAIHADRVGKLHKERLPEALVSATNDFKDRLIAIDRSLSKGADDEEKIKSEVFSACTMMHDTLVHHVGDMSDEAESIGTFVFRDTFPFFMSSRLIERSFNKPKGYAGDFLTIYYMYENVPAGDGRLGSMIDAWALSEPLSRANRSNLGFINKTARAVAALRQNPDPVRIMSLGSGSALELMKLCDGPDPIDFRATCIDIDPEAVTFAGDLAEKRKAKSRFHFYVDNIVQLSLGKGRVEITKKQHLIYTLGLTDYLDEPSVVSLLNWIFDGLVPGGMVALSNHHPDNPNRIFMEAICEWKLVYRNEDDLRRLFANTKFGNQRLNVRLDDSGVQMHATCMKA